MLSTQGKGIHGVKDAAKKPTSAVNNSAHLPVAAIDFWKSAVYARNQKLWSGIREVSPVAAPCYTGLYPVLHSERLMCEWVARVYAD